MEIYQGTSHCGLVIMYDFGDGKGYRLAVFQSTSVANIATQAKTITTAVFMDDSNAGPNITALDEIGHWDAFGHPDYTKGSDAFMLDPNNESRLSRKKLFGRFQHSPVDLFTLL